jgi:hypothetical protein
MPQLARWELTLAAEQSWELPELGHVKGLKDLALVTGTVTCVKYISALALKKPGI